MIEFRLTILYLTCALKINTDLCNVRVRAVRSKCLKYRNKHNKFMRT